MIHGHYAAALVVAATVGGRVPLPWLFVATQAQDLLVCIFHALDIESSRVVSATGYVSVKSIYMPFSHSLFSTLVLAVAFALATTDLRNSRNAVFLVVLSHYLLDVASHVPDMEVCWPFAQCPKIGLGLFRYRYASIVVESLIIFFSVAWFVRSLPRSVSRAGIVLRMFPMLLFMLVFTTAFPFIPPAPKMDWIVVGQAWGMHSCCTGYIGWVEQYLKSAYSGAHAKES